MAIVAKYTPEEVTKLAEMYQAGETVQNIAVAMGRTSRSVIAKLSGLKLYKTAEINKTPRVLKLDLVTKIAHLLNISEDAAESLEKANHETLALIAKTLEDHENFELDPPDQTSV